MASISIQRGRVVDVVLRVPTMRRGASKTGGQAPRRRSASRPEKAGEEAGEGDEISKALIAKGLVSLETPVRMGSHLVEVLGFEPRSISFLVNILRAQPTGDCRECCCSRQRRHSVVS